MDAENTSQFVPVTFVVCANEIALVLSTGLGFALAVSSEPPA